MATNPVGPETKGWHNDPDNNRLEYYFNGTKIGHLNASGFTVTDGTTARMTDGLVQNAGMAAVLKRTNFIMGTHAAIASDGANSVLPEPVFVAPAACQIVSAFVMNLTASDVTTGAAASYRRMQLICNTAAAGTGTDIIASVNVTASAALNVTRGLTTIASTVPAGGVVLVSHLTVGAASADRTDAAARVIGIEYELT